MITREEKQNLIQSRPWYHSIEIEEGLVTPGRLSLTHLRQMLRYLDFPESFEGLSILDIGAWDGFFSFEAEKRGAKRVVAFDLNPPDYYGFNVAKKLLNSQVEFVQGNVYDLSSDIHGTFDVVFFFGVFYHLRYPLLALDRIRQIVKQFILLETNYMDSRLILADGTAVPLLEINKHLIDVPLYRFYRFDELLPGDFSNWFSPNRRAIEDALWSAGFRPEFLATWGDRIAFRGSRLEAIPEYLLETYEGLQWQSHTDGSQSPIIYSRTAVPARAPSPNTVTGPRVRTESTNELQTSPQEELMRLRPQIGTLNENIAQLRTQLAELRTRTEALLTLLYSIQRTRAYRLLRRMGFWEWVENQINRLRPTSAK